MEGYQDLSLRSRVFKQLREDILTGKYKENDELREITLGNELGVSRTPVREALRQLELEGLVKIVPNKGAYVTGISAKDVNDIYLIRSLLEGLCARLATEHITDEQINRLEEVILLSEFHLTKKLEQASQVSRLDNDFHAVLYEACNSRILEHVLSDYHKYVQLARTTSIENNDRAEKSIAEHKEILEAIKNKDADLADRLSHQHVLNARKSLNIDMEE